jgi:hypothetical protein
VSKSSEIRVTVSPLLTSFPKSPLMLASSLTVTPGKQL